MDEGHITVFLDLDFEIMKIDFFHPSNGYMMSAAPPYYVPFSPLAFVCP
jgi:hypothetical protein